MTHVQGIIVHQTGSPTARSTLNGYGVARANGAHFLIDKDGTIYQTASVLKQTAHVGMSEVAMHCNPHVFENRDASLAQNGCA
jgi:N-acetyl-anhydromuramyl-L-alanine amidase AmpD